MCLVTCTPGVPSPAQVNLKPFVSGQHGQERLVEVVALGDGVLEVVGEDDLQGHPDPVLGGLDVVAGVGDDREVRCRGPDHGHGTRRAREDAGERQRDTEPAEPPAEGADHASGTPWSSGRRAS